MDEIDRAKIGKKDEPLIGWDHIRKPKKLETDLPPMRAKGVDDKYKWLLSEYRGSPQHQKKSGWGWYFALLIVLVIISAKLIGIW